MLDIFDGHRLPGTQNNPENSDQKNTEINDNDHEKKTKDNYYIGKNFGVINDLSNSSIFSLKISIVSLENDYRNNDKSSNNNDKDVLSYMVHSPINKLNSRKEIHKIDIKEFPNYRNSFVKIIVVLLFTIFNLIYLFRHVNKLNKKC